MDTLRCLNLTNGSAAQLRRHTGETDLAACVVGDRCPVPPGPVVTSDSPASARSLDGVSFNRGLQPRQRPDGLGIDFRVVSRVQGAALAGLLPRLRGEDPVYRREVGQGTRPGATRG